MAAPFHRLDQAEPDDWVVVMDHAPDISLVVKGTQNPLPDAVKRIEHLLPRIAFLVGVNGPKYVMRPTLRAFPVRVPVRVPEVCYRARVSFPEHALGCPGFWRRIGASPTAPNLKPLKLLSERSTKPWPISTKVRLYIAAYLDGGVGAYLFG